MRTFTSASGRRWTVDVYELPKSVAILAADTRVSVQTVLRFSSDQVTLDLVNYPADWNTKTDADLVALLRQATTPAFAPRTESDQASRPVRPSSLAARLGSIRHAPLPNGAAPRSAPRRPD